MSKTSVLVTLLPNLFLLYLIFYNMEFLSGKRQFYGVVINYEYTSREEFRLLDKSFKKLTTLWFFLVLIISLVFIYGLDKNEFAFSFSIIAAIVSNGIIYIRTHNKVKELKSKIIVSEDSSNVSPSSKAIVDMKFLNERDAILKKFKIIYAVPVLIVSICSIYGIINYQNMPYMIPTHWSITGQADSFIEKSFSNVVFAMLSHSFMTAFMAFVAISSMKSRLKVDVENIDDSRSANLKYLTRTGYTFLAIIISLSLMFVNIIISSANNKNINGVINTISFITTILFIIYSVILYLKSPNAKSNSSYTPDDDEKYWLFGFIYNNPNDPSFMVQKRFGVGWTINIGTPLGKVLFFITIIIIIFSVLSLIKTAL